MKRFTSALLAVGATVAIAIPVLASGQHTIRISDGRILQSGGSAGSLPGAEVCSFDATSAHAIATAQAGPNGGVNVTGFSGPDAGGNCASATVTVLPTPTATSIPTSGFAAAAGLGTSPPSITLTTGSDWTKGLVQFGTGTSPASGAILTATYPQTFTNAPAVFLEPYNAVAQGLGLYVSNVGTSGFTISAATAPSASQGGTVYEFLYVVVP